MTVLPPVKILYLADSLLSTRAGTERQLHQLVPLLGGRAFDVKLVALSSGGQSPDSTWPVPLIPLGTGNVTGRNVAARVGRLFRLLRHERPDVLQTFFIDSIYVGTLAGRLARTPVVVTSRRDLGYWYTKRHLQALRLVNRWADGIIVNSEAVRRHVVREEKADPERVHVVPNGLDTTPFRRDALRRASMRDVMHLAEGEVAVGMVANLRPVKGVGLFLEALQSLVGEPGWRAFIVGDGPLRAELEARAGQPELAGRVRFLGSIPHVEDVLQAFDIVVASSESEGLSNSVLEAMAAGLPIVATNVGGNEELLGDGRGVLVRPGDASALASAIRQLITDPARRRSIGHAAAEHAAYFGWDNVMPRVERLYRSLLARRRLM